MADVRDRMPNDEFVAWSVYHGRRAQQDELAMKRAKAKGR